MFSLKYKMNPCDVPPRGGRREYRDSSNTKKQEIVFRLTGSGEPTKYVWRNKGSDYTYGSFAHDLVQRWLNSRGHRNNILSRGYGFLGVGAAYANYEGQDVFFITQNFSTVNY